jgi:ABC-2 type transport system ATP-binding protein
VLDEPFAGVDPAGVALLRGLLTRARERGATILLNSHRLDQVGRLCDKVALLTRGNLERVMETTPGGGDDELERLVIGAASDGAPS